MKVLINRVVNLTKGYTVAYSNEYGSTSVFWNGAKPQINKEYFVEIEVPGVLNWQKDITITDMNCKIEELDNGIAYISGVLESIEDDGYTIMKIGDSIIAIETQGEPPIIRDVNITRKNGQREDSRKKYKNEQ